jgi:glyoxalase family protein
MTILGLHHVTLVCSDAQRTVDFYTQVLGQRLVKKTVNFDDPYSYHLYFGDAIGRPGTAVTFFEWASAPQGRPGIGGTDHVALTVPGYDGLLKWKRRLTDGGVNVAGPMNRGRFFSIYFNDPDGAILEVATLGHDWTPVGWSRRRREAAARSEQPTAETGPAGDTWPEPVSEITPDMALENGMHHITAISSDLDRTDAFLGELLGLPRIGLVTDLDRGGADHAYWGAGPGNLLTYVERDASRKRRRRMGPGQTHHFALAVRDEDEQREWRERLMSAGLRVTPIIDRVYFKSIYTQDPDGHIVELATLGPGFLVDELETDLGRGLQLPPWLEANRAEIESHLHPIQSIDQHTPVQDVKVR